MKRIGTALLILSTVASAAEAAGVKFRLESQEVDALKAFDAIGDFCGIKDWHPDVTGCEIGERDGKQIRTLTLKDGGHMVDRLDAYDKGTLTWVISTIEGPFPVQWLMAKLSVKPDDEGGAGIKWVGTFEPQAGASEEAAKAPIENFYKHGIEGLFAKLGVKPKS
ncbi:SRPBCC family protein [Oryzibacter oryziterrae]|uniref:SRPBCC family protein n=1 Tax=Oryzibacter oryziterrae TaxID=2766474 RepID=UPI001F349F30|nr:SRPBCC family protein [Oryzibacter oryziterrae]